MNLPYLANPILLFLFVIAFASLIWATWKRTKVTPRFIMCVLGLAIMAFADSLMIIHQHVPFLK